MLSLARAVSVAGHPFLLVPVTIALVTGNWIPAAAIAATMTLPMLVITMRRVRRGTWSDHDVSRREQRTGLYRIALPLLVPMTVVLYLLGAERQMLRGVAAAAFMLLAGLLLHRWLKTSMHMMAAAYCAALVVRVYPSWWVAAVAVVLAIAWSRLALQRHTLPEVMVGAALGAACGWWATS